MVEIAFEKIKDCDSETKSKLVALREKYSQKKKEADKCVSE